jgi:hypothetical protein
MKTIKLKTLKHQDVDMPYADMIKGVVNGVDPREGVTVDDMKKRLRIVTALENAKGDTLKLEDADYDLLAQKVRANKWAMVSPAIVEFCDDIAAAGKES